MNWFTFSSAFISEILAMLPYRILSYYPLRTQLRFSARTVALIIGITQALQCTFFAWLTVTGHSVRFTDLFFSFTCFIIFFICIKADPWKLLFLYVFNFDYVVLMRGITIFLESRFFAAPHIDFHSIRSSLINFLAFMVTTPMMLIFFKRTKDRVFQTDAPLFWKTIWLLPTFTTVIVLMFTWDLSPEYTQKPQFILSRILLILGIFVVYYTLLHALDGIRRQAALEEQTRQQEELLTLQHSQYQQLSRHIEEVTQARHDLRQHLKLIKLYLKEGRTDLLSQYIEQYEQSLPPDIEITLCRNYAVNTIVSYYRSASKQSGIDFSAVLDLPEKLPVSEPDFCSVVGNLLENALEACCRAGSDSPFIRIRAKEEMGRIALIVDNTCPVPPAENAGKLQSSRHDGSGIGSASVKRIAERYHGTAEFRCQNGVFYASVLMTEE